MRVHHLRSNHALLGIWRIADPKITLASVASMTLGAAAAARDGPIDPLWLALTFLGIFFLEAAKNASGEIFDFDSGTDQAVAGADRSPFSGGKRVLVDGLMTRRDLAITAAIFYTLGAGAGLAITFVHEPRVLAFGIAGVALAYFYHAPPIALSHRGLGELSVGLAYGPLIAAGTYVVQRHAISTNALLLSIPLGLLIAAFLVINEFPDAEADASANKRTLVVRLGKRRGSLLYAALAALAFALLAALAITAAQPWILLGLAGLPLSIRAAARLYRRRAVTKEIIAAQAWSLVAFLLLAGGMSLGLLA